ncbi:Phage tail sheath subtilisin-like domain-containing protein [Sulfidibacter corallicola]|uniref:Phage tail sheath subtilisin-like domain-containing protein n=1 Tax=Sulfidibacter corallicola TaxID=2818388 RepID=A0A8A4TLA0_SULCO|nr:phage tail sheath C-terminal domain-containing protein [Sulfidibacter corallicola]QTD49661.1 phage tail sheath subtilisin-like domain-containing protein [Sulfidibacter corallicola]
MTAYLSPGVYTKETDFSYYVRQISTSTAGMVGVAERGPINQPQLVTSWEQYTNRFGGYTANGYLAYAARSFFDNGGRNLFVNRIAHLSDPTNRASVTARRATTTLRDRRQVAASLTTGTAGNDEITWTATVAGAAGNAITIEVLATGNDSPLTVDVADNAVTIRLATDSGGIPITTVAELRAALAVQASAVILAESEDSGVVAPFAVASLAGGSGAGDTLTVSAASEGSWGDYLEVIASESGRGTGTYDLAVRYRGQQVEVFRDLSMDENAPNHCELAVNGVSAFIVVEDLNPGSNSTDDQPQVGASPLASGDDGLTGLSDQDYIGDPSQHTGLYAFQERDALNMLAVPGVSSSAVIAAGAALAESRRDLMFLVDPPMLLEPLEVIDFRKGEGLYSHAPIQSSYAAMYYPWLKISDPVTGRDRLIPPSGAVAGCYARSDLSAYVWRAPAGIARGRVFNVLGVGYRLSQGEMDALYPEGINPIAVFDDSGVTVWGQRTLWGQSTALDRVNVRRLMIYLEEAISKSSRFVVFEPNNEQTWRAIKRTLNPFLREVQDKGGLAAYRVQCDEDTNPPAVIDRNEIGVRIFVTPVKAAEMVELNFTLTPTGANFQEIYTGNRR